MSGRARWAKADERRRARWSAQRERIRAQQAGRGPFEIAEILAAFESGRLMACDPETTARRWNAAHPDRLPVDGAQYARRRRARARRRR